MSSEAGTGMGWLDIAPARLENAHVLVRPIEADDHKGLHAIAMDHDIWRYFVSMVTSDASFDEYFDATLAEHRHHRRVVFVVVDKANNAIAGTSSYGNMSEPDLRLEIGWTWLGREYRGRGLNRWVKFLLLEHAFGRLGAERVEFKTDQRNEQARRGLRNIGATEEGTLRSYNPMPGGRRRDAVYYSVIRPEWSAIRAQLQASPKVRRPSAP
jgi:RimJ/RimL family protein N-acetyltransferase